MTHTLVSVEVDKAGNTGSTSAELVIVVDNATTAPGQPVLVAADDTGIPGDSSTTVGRPRLTGTAEAGAVVTLLDSGVNVGVGTADSAGTWTIQTTNLAVGTHSIVAVAVDAAGNQASGNSELSLVISETLSTPQAPSLLGADDSAAIDSTNGDRVTSVVNPRFTGSTGANFLVTLFVDGVSVGQGTADGFGEYTIGASTLSEATHAVSVQVQDPSTGLYSSTSLPMQIVIDTTAPAGPSATMAASSDSSSAALAAYATDGITNVTAPTLTGTAEAGSQVLIQHGATTLGVTTANSGGQWTFATAGISLADGVQTLGVTAVDAANNKSTVTNLVITVDTASVTPGTPMLLVSSDTGISNSDGVTRATAPTVSGTGAEAGSIVVLLANGVSVGQAIADAGGAYTVSAASALLPGAHALSVRAIDPAGNNSTPSGQLMVTVDTQTAQPSGLTLDNDTFGAGTSGTDADRLTNVTAAQISGRAEAGAAVTLYAGAASVGEATADMFGNWTVTTAPLASGTHTLSARAVDAAGNTSALSAPLGITVDTASTAPTLVLAAGSDTFGAGTAGSAADGLTTRDNPVVGGTAEAGALIIVRDGGVSIAEALANGSGNWQVTLDLGEGAHTLSASAIDRAGNTSAASADLAVTVDKTLGMLVPTLVNDTGASASDLLTNSAMPQVAVTTAEAGVVLTLLASGVSVASVTAGAAGAYTLAPGSLTDGVHSLTFRQVDAAGNTNTSAALAVTVDTTITAPRNMALLAGDDSEGLGTAGTDTDRLTNINAPRITGTGEGGAVAPASARPRPPAMAAGPSAPAS